MRQEALQGEGHDCLEPPTPDLGARPAVLLQKIGVARRPLLMEALGYSCDGEEPCS